MLVTEQEKQFLEGKISAVALASSNLNDVLLPLDEWIALNGFDESYDLTDEGRAAQRIYDSIVSRNLTN